MIENFEKVKNQLKELSDVINSFSSEAVQLRIVELIFGVAKGVNHNNGDQQSQESVKPPTRRRKTRSKFKASVLNDDTTKKKPVTSGQGPVATLVKLAEGDFFEAPQSMKSIIEHCEVNLARKIKQTDISGKLARMVREGVLRRAKNSDDQYEYSKA